MLIGRNEDTITMIAIMGLVAVIAILIIFGLSDEYRLGCYVIPSEYVDNTIIEMEDSHLWVVEDGRVIEVVMTPCR